MTDHLNTPELVGRLQAMATADPDFAHFAQQYADLGEHTLRPDEQAELAQDLVRVLRACPAEKQKIDPFLQAPSFQQPQRFEGGLASLSFLIATVFLLRSHIKIKRHRDGKLELLFEHKPIPNKLLSDLVKRISSRLPGNQQE